jgi:pimeloyl-ACP methyl ester carboxylesterase
MEAKSIAQPSTGEARAELREREIVADGLRSPVIEAGPTDATEAVVMVHGNPGSKGDWVGMLGRVGEFARAVAPDMPGFGKADKPRDFDYTPFGYAMQLDYMLGELGVQRAHYVGHDWGGGFVLGCGLLNPARTASFTLINTGMLRGYRWHKWARIWQTPVLGELSMLATNRRAFDTLMRGMPQDFIDEMWDNFDTGTRRAVLKLYRAARDPNTIVQTALPLYRQLNLPACIVWGVRDPFVPAKYAKRNLEAFPSGELHMVEGAGHWPFVDKPDEVGDIVCDFLRRQMGAVSTPPPE